MKLLEEKIRQEGKVIGTDILKVDMFLNHQIDVNLLDEMGKEFYRLFKNKGVNKILTVESSGIAIAVMAAKYFNVPVSELLGEDPDNEKSPSELALTEGEMELLELFRLIPEAQQRHFLEIGRAYANSLRKG